jgi:hypothetical protein
MESWNFDFCDPPLDESEIATVVDSAMRNRGNAIGVLHPTNASGFEPA